MLKQINVEQLRVGMFIQKFCSTWDESPFWRTSLLLDNLKDLHAIQVSDVAEVWIDTSKGLDVEKPVVEKNEVEATAQKIVSPPVIEPRRASFDDEMARAKKICADGKTAVTTMFQEARMGNALNTAQAHSLVEEISSSVMRNPDALISLARLKNKDDYTYMHSVAVCALMIALARKMKLDDRQIRDAGLAGLLHDVGKMMISQSILDKPGQLTDEEFVAVKEHPVEGHKILSVSPDVSEAALDVCLHHHERFDGTGYPHRLEGENISLFARMGAVCDVYDAITSNRAYKAGWEPSESLRRMAEWKGHFDPVVFQAFVKCIGIYPTGALVRLKTGRIGVVVEQSEHSLLTPRVKVFFSVKSNAHIPPELVDLAKLEGYDKIVGLEDAQKLGLKNVHGMWEGAA
ncbi:HD-GYP domain-containing protein [Herminiimonas fonticola]|uniref:HD-GYP domain-containing protein n=1 Tax=Herminiimonas fonticola TaxID=303380 RepID=UPI00333ED1FC